jgi:hypothetical protein
MIYLAKRLLEQETDADKIEFIRGASGLLPGSGTKKVLSSVAVGYLLSKVLSNRG